MNIKPLTLCVVAGILTFVAHAIEPLKTEIDQRTFDPTTKLGDDFFQHVNGGWIKANPIPPEYSRWDVDSEIQLQNLDRLRGILDDLAKDTGPLDEDRRKLRDFWMTAMDEKALEKQGFAPLQEHFARIAQLEKSEELPKLLADFKSRGIDFLFSLYVDQDAKQSTRYMVQLSQGGTVLPERDYYVGDAEDSKKIRNEYHQYIQNMQKLFGETPEQAKKTADVILRLETSLAEASRAPVALRDPEKNYNKKTIAELEAMVPSIKWNEFLKTIGTPTAKEVIVGQPEFFERVETMMKTVPADEWRTYLRWQLIDATAGYLCGEFEREHFHFHATVMRGVKEMKPRWKRVIEATDGHIGEILGKIYVEKYFPPAAKNRMNDLCANLKLSYKDHILSRDWMGEETKKQALVKLAKMGTKIGYPNKWKDYSTLETKTDSLCQNAMRAWAFDFKFRANRLDKAVDREEWSMTPPTINAYYDPSKNEFVFPAGILQPPYFGPTADDAFNYGAIGAVIGHEMTHGFDDEGSKFDADGNLNDWWTKEDRTRFEAKTALLVKQFNESVAIDGLHINGELTLGENLADLGGVTIAYDAYMKSLGGKPAPIINGYTGAQRFFIAYAISWRGHQRPDNERLQLRTDPHSPVRFRVNIPLSNCPPFYEAFEIKPGEKMYRKPEDRVQVW